MFKNNYKMQGGKTNIKVLTVVLKHTAISEEICY